MTSPTWWPDAIKHLSHDSSLAKLIHLYPAMPESSHPQAFPALARAIVGQQISTKAAASIWERLCTNTQIKPHTIASLAHKTLRSYGISQKKSDYLYDLSKHFIQELDKFDWANHTDDEIIQRLIKIHGIGRWSAQMFLIFHLSRPDVLPLDDLGLRRAMELTCMNGV